jgi:hypothetical protein
MDRQNIYSPSANLSELEKRNKFGLRDKTDQGPGLVQKNPEDAQFTTVEHNLVIDTRDCIGTNSLADAKAYFGFIGGRGAAYGTVISTTAVGVYPTIVTLDSVLQLKDGDTITIKNARGNTAINGVQVISAVTVGPNTISINATTNGVYLGTGTWSRATDSGYPKITDKDSTIIGNTITVNLEAELKLLRSLTLFHIVIPRDIIPLNYLLLDFISASIDDVDVTYTGIATTSFTTLIPQEDKYMQKRILGFYSSPIDLWRTYTGAAFSMPNQVTPPPLKLWNPPGPGAWPLQPLPYPFQVVPTYK